MGGLYPRTVKGAVVYPASESDFYHTETGVKLPVRTVNQLPELPKPPLRGPDPAPDRLMLRPLALFAVG